VKRIRYLAGRAALAGAVATAALTGCSLASPATIITPYPASDGVSASISGSNVQLRNFLVIGTAKGAPASVIGALVNDGSQPAKVYLTADLGQSAQPSQTIVQIPAHAIARVGPNQRTEMTIPDLPVEPGAVTGITAATDAGGRTDLQNVPVLTPEGPYASLAPPATPSTGATSSPEATPSTLPSEPVETLAPTTSPTS
jgi:hypothetical protein